MKANTGSTCVQVQCLPPTEAAARFHSFRVYLQVQTWIGNKLNPVEWGWCLKGNKLISVKTDLAAAPARLLKVIRCTCKVNCESRRKNMGSSVLMLVVNAGELIVATNLNLYLET